MEKYDFDIMPAGEQMDTMIAKEIMGWDWGILPVKDSDREAKIWTTDLPDGFILHAIAEEWHPSSNPIEALEVVNKLDELYSAWFKIQGPRRWLVYCHCPHGGPFSGVADDLPLAICRAALKAVWEAKKAMEEGD